MSIEKESSVLYKMKKAEIWKKLKQVEHKSTWKSSRGDMLKELGLVDNSKIKKTNVWKELKKFEHKSSWKTSKREMLAELNASLGFMVSVGVRLLPYTPSQNDIELLYNEAELVKTKRYKKDPRVDKDTYNEIERYIHGLSQEQSRYRKSFVVIGEEKYDFEDRQNLYKNRNKKIVLPLTVTRVIYTPSGIEHIVLKAGCPPEYPSLGLNSDCWNIVKDKCVFNALLNQLQGQVKFKNLTRAKLIQDLPEYPTIGDVYKWLTVNKVPAYIIDGSSRVVFHTEVLGTNDVTKCVYFKIDNNHIYPITDIKLQDEIRYNRKILRPKIQWGEDHVYIKQPEIKELKGITVVDCDLEVLFLDAFNNGVMVENVDVNQTGAITKFSYKDNWVVRDKDYNTTISALEFCKELPVVKQSDVRTKKFDYRGQSLQCAVNELIDIFKVGALPKSTLTQHNLEIFNKQARGAYNRTLVDTQGTHTVDIRRCHTDVLYNRRHCWGVFSCFDDFETFDGTIYEGSFLYVKNVYLPIGPAGSGMKLGDGIYDSEFVENCLNEGLIVKSQITKQLQPFNSLPAGYFKEVIDIIYNNFPDETAKPMINRFVGTLNPRNEYMTDAFITASKDMANEHAKSTSNAFREIHNLYLCYTEKVKVQIETNKPMYYSVICGSYWSLYKLGKFLNPKKVIKYHSDSITIVGQVVLPTADKPHGLGSYRFTVLDEADRREVDNGLYGRPFVHPSLKGPGTFIYGSAGRGKTYKLVNDILPTLDKYVCSSTTHKVLSNLRERNIYNTKTLALLFTIPIGVNKLSFLQRLVDKHKVLIVDEYTMTSQYHMKMIYYVYRLGMMIICVGDDKQTPGIDNKLIEFSKRNFWKEMMGTVIHLTHNYRFDEALDQVAMGVHKGVFKYDRVGQSESNICYTNKKRIEINKLYMRGRTVGDLKFNKGTPVISVKNENGLYNGLVFKVQRITDTHVYVNNTPFDYNTFRYQFDLAYCVTTHKLQGTTSPGVVVIHESEKMSRQLLYTALSRLTSLDNLRVPYAVNLTNIRNENFVRGKNYTTCLTQRLEGYVYSLEQDGVTVFIGSTTDMKQAEYNHRDWPVPFEMKELKIVRYEDVQELKQAEMSEIRKYTSKGYTLFNTVGEPVVSKKLKVREYIKNTSKPRGQLRQSKDKVEFRWSVSNKRHSKVWRVTKSRSKEQAVALAEQLQMEIYN